MTILHRPYKQQSLEMRKKEGQSKRMYDIINCIWDARAGHVSAFTKRIDREKAFFFPDRLRKDTVSEKGGGFMKGEGLERFVKAQEQSYGQALQEIQNGWKRSHWMWYIFPQIQGLGHSPTAQYYAVRDQAEAKAYMAHPVLGSRLLEISKELLRLKSSNAKEVLGSPDDMKLKSSMTLFETVSDEPVFGRVLDKFFAGERDMLTLDFLKKENGQADQGAGRRNL